MNASQSDSFNGNGKKVAIFSPKKAILTNLHSEFDYKILKSKLPKNIVPAYDGLKLYF